LKRLGLPHVRVQTLTSIKWIETLQPEKLTQIIGSRAICSEPLLTLNVFVKWLSYK
jgi:hypothetical protein